MIKKLLGVIAALAVVAVVVLTVLHRDKYRSMVFDDGFPSSLVPASILRPASAASAVVPATEASESEARACEAADSVAAAGAL